MKTFQKGFSVLLSILVILAVVLVSVGVSIYIVQIAKPKPAPTVNQTVPTQSAQNPSTQTQTRNQISSSVVQTDASNWQTYRNDFFEIKYSIAYKPTGEKSDTGELNFETVSGVPEIFITRGENKLAFQGAWVVIPLDTIGPIGHGNMVFFSDDASINGIQFKKKYRVIRSTGNNEWLAAIVYYGCNVSADCFSILRGVTVKGISTSTLTKEEEDRDMRWYGEVMPDEKQAQEIINKINESPEAIIIDRMISTFKFIGLRSDLKMQYGAKGIESFIPDGWVIIAQAEGDLNNDGLPDLAIVVEDHSDKYKLYFGDTGKGECMMSEICLRKLLILTKKNSNAYNLALESDKAILDNGDYVYIAYVSSPSNLVKIQDNSLLIEFTSGGSITGATADTYKFVYQNNGWYLVEKDHTIDAMRAVLNNGSNDYCPPDAFKEYEKYNYLKGTVEKFTGPLIEEAYATNGDYQCNESDRSKAGTKSVISIEKNALVNLKDFNPRNKN